MSDSIYGGSTENIGGGFKAGLNEDVYLSITFEPQVTHGTYTGPVISVTRTKDGQSFSEAFYPINPDNITPRNVPETDDQGKYVKDENGKTVYRMQTKDEAVKEAAKQLNTHLKILVTGYGIESEEAEKAFKQKYSSFEEYAHAILKLLPADHPTRKGKLILIYKNSGFTRLPYNSKITGRYWLADGVENKEIKVTNNEYYLEKYFTRPVQADDSTSDTPESPTEW